jgi:hypothetical protein
MSRLAVIDLLSEFSGTVTPKDAARAVISVCQSLQTIPVTDADRVGERLLVIADRKRLDGYHWICDFRIVGEESGHQFGDFDLNSINDEGGSNIEACERLELLITTYFYASLNGAARFSKDEKAALAEAYSIAIGKVGHLPIKCDYCDATFLFWSQGLEHEAACLKNPNRTS